MIAAAAILLLIGPIRLGDLAGYDDAVYAHIAKTIVKSGKWIDIQSNGYPALEHPPGFVWMQAVLFSLFGFSDFLAKLPSAACGVGTVLLVFWLTRRLIREEQAALHPAGHPLVVAGADRLRDHGVDREEHPDPGNPREVEIQVPEPAGRELGRGDPAEHHDIDDPHQLLPEADEHDRPRDRQHLPQLSARRTEPREPTQHRVTPTRWSRAAWNSRRTRRD